MFTFAKQIFSISRHLRAEKNNQVKISNGPGDPSASTMLESNKKRKERETAKKKKVEKNVPRNK